MAGSKKRKLLHIILLSVLLVIAGVAGYLIWFSHHYKQVIKDRLPEIVLKSTDSVYHISFSDIDISIFDRHITIYDLKLWPDMKQVNALKQQRRRTPPTLSTVSIPLLEAYGITWENLIEKKSLDCSNVVVHDLKWLMVCQPAIGDSLFGHDKRQTPAINRVTSARVDFNNPDITYNYIGQKENFQCYMKGGTAVLNNFVYNYDQSKDTSLFLYAHSGKVRFENFIFNKPSGHYSIITPDLDFATTPNTVTLKLIKIKHMVNHDPETGKEKENYNLGFPAIELVGFNWNRLIDDGELIIPKVNATAPTIEIRYIRENADKNGRKGSYPNQLLLQVGLKTDIKELNINKAHFKYTELTKKGDEGTIEFGDIKGTFSNITNMPEVITCDKSCVVKLQGKYMDKSDVAANFDLGLADAQGHFTLDGNIKNLTGDEVSQQAQAFTIVKVTSFRLARMDMHIEGDQTYSKGDFTVLYDGLKLSLFKFDSKQRQGQRGPFAFVGSALLLYPGNPMPHKEVRKVTTSFARDTTMGFISVLWQNMYRAVKKTAVREPAIVTISDGPETSRGEQPKKGFFKRLFKKK